MSRITSSVDALYSVCTASVNTWGQVRSFFAGICHRRLTTLFQHTYIHMPRGIKVVLITGSFMGLQGMPFNYVYPHMIPTQVLILNIVGVGHHEWLWNCRKACCACVRLVVVVVFFGDSDLIDFPGSLILFLGHWTKSCWRSKSETFTIAIARKTILLQQLLFLVYSYYH